MVPEVLLVMPDSLIEALRSRNLAAVRDQLTADPAKARRPQAVVEAGRLAFQDALELLLQHGANPNASHRGYRALHSLLQEVPYQTGVELDPGRLACLEWLLDHGADPEQPAAWPPARALIVAAFVGHPGYIGVLRDKGARVDGFVAAALGDRTLVQQALDATPRFAVERDPSGFTALQCVAGSRMRQAPLLEIAGLLLDAGADIGALIRSWSHDVDAVHLAASAKNKAIFDLLLDRGADASAALGPALLKGGLDYAESCLAHGADPGRALSDGRPLLNELIRWGHLTQVFWLLDHGANPNLPDERGWTAVHQAASRGNDRMWQAVLRAGGDVTKRDQRDDTPLDIAGIMGRTKFLPQGSVR